MESALDDGKPCCRFVQTLEKNIGILGEETRHNLQIITALDGKLEWFNDVSSRLSDKLCSLRSLAQAHDSGNNEILEFVQQISISWTNASKQICKKYSGIRVASRTVPGMPLSLMLDKVKKEVFLAKLSLKVDDATHCKQHVTNGCTLINKFAKILHSLERCDSKVQQYLAILKITPYLIHLESTIEKFVSNIELCLIKSTTSSHLSVFPIVVKLLTGELLGHEPINLPQVLAENAPKKPIFIIKNNKRRVEIPTLTAVRAVKSTADLNILNQ